jgi:hypothetical protein
MAKERISDRVNLLAKPETVKALGYPFLSPFVITGAGGSTLQEGGRLGRTPL